MTGDTMTPRERVLAAIRFQGPDRVPFQHAVFPGALWNHGRALVDFLNQFPDDISGSRFEIPPEPEAPGGIEEYRDEWGSLWRRRKGYTTGEVVEPALRTWDEWPSYALPAPPPPQHFEELRDRIRSSPRDRIASMGGGNLFERMQFLRGTENLFLDLAEDRSEVHELADAIVEYYMAFIEGGLLADVDVFWFGDDWGTQNRLLIHPQTWRRFFKPRYRRLMDPIRNEGKEIVFHTDGWTVEIWDDLIELGVTVLNPQHPLMPRQLLEEKLAGCVCIRSDLDRQHIIPFGTPDDVREHVKDTIALFGRFDGGLILHGEVGPEVPLENVMALVQAFCDYGRYPLDWLDCWDARRGQTGAV